MMLSFLPTPILAGGFEDYPGYTVLYLDQNPITIGDDGVNYYITQTDPNTPTANGISITGGNHSIVLDNLNIQQENSYSTTNTIDITGGTQAVVINNVTINGIKSNGASVLGLSNGAHLNFTVQGTNTFNNSVQGCTIEVPTGTELLITAESTGILNVTNNGTTTSSARQGAVIGSQSSKVAGTITINGGTLNVEGELGSAAGIGGGARGGGGAITINGGMVTVKVQNAAAIGDGLQNSNKGTITINGGTVYAQRTPQQERVKDFPAIGTAMGATSGTTVTINGGSIHSETFYNNALATKVYVSVLERELYLAKVQIENADNQAVTNIQVNGNAYGSTDVYTDGDGWLYLWLPVGDTTVTFTCDGTEYTFNGTVATDNTSVLGSGNGGNDPTDPKDALKAAAIAACLDIPVYDGTNQAVIAAKVSAAEAALEAALVEWSPLDVRGWEGYRRYADAKALENISFPTVTLTVMGQPESDSETAHYFIEPTNYSVPAGSTVAEVICAALDNSGLTYTYTGKANWNGGFFLTSIGNQANTGSIGWMYMVDNNAYINLGLSEKVAANGANILLYYSTTGFNSGGADSDSTNPSKTPYGTYTSFNALLTAAGTTVVDLKGSTADTMIERDWTVISADIGSIRVHTDAIPLTAVGANGSCITWSSEKPEVVANDGRITLQDTETQVTLTATLSYGGQTKQKTLTVTVGKAEGTSVTLTVSGAATTDNVALGPTAITGLSGTEKYAILDNIEYGKNIAAMDALVQGLGENTAALVPENLGVANSTIGSLFSLGYDAATGRRWMVRVTNRAGVTAYTGDHTDNLLTSLADGDLVHYRYVAGTEALKTLYNSVVNVTGASYSTSSYETFDSARTAAKVLLEGDGFTLTQAEVDEVYSSLQAAFTGLVFTLDYFAGGEDSVHQKVLNWLVDNPIEYGDANGEGNNGRFVSWAFQASGAPGLVALALNGMLTDAVIHNISEVPDDVTGSVGRVIYNNLSNWYDPPTHNASLTHIALTDIGNDMTYYYCQTFINNYEYYEYAMDIVMAGSAGGLADTEATEANQLILLNGPTYYPEYQNRMGTDKPTVEMHSGTTSQNRELMSVGLTREYMITRLLSRQHTDGGWTASLNGQLDKKSNAAVTAYVLIALAPYYWEDIGLPASIQYSDLKNACDRALEYMKSDVVKADRFNSTKWVTYNSYSQVCLNALMFYGIDPESIKNDTGDGMITYTLKTFLAEDMAHFEVPGWGNNQAGLFTARFAEMMEYYKQYLTYHRAFLYGGKEYKNQTEKRDLEQVFFEARWATLGYTPYEDAYTWQDNYTEESVTVLLEALDTAYSALVDLNATAEQINAAQQAIEDAIENLVPNTPEGAVIQKIKALKDITPENTLAAEVAAAREAYEALTAEQQALVTNYEDLLDAEHWFAIAEGYKAATGINSYITNIGNTYAALGTEVSDDWKVVDMAIAGRVNEMLDSDEDIQDFVTKSIGRIEPDTMTEYERVLIAVTALGVDGADLTKYCAFYDKKSNLVTSLVDEIANFDGGIEVNSMIWGLVALDSGDYEVAADAKWTRDAMIAQLLEFQLDSGAWPIYKDEDANVDTTAMAIVALVPYMEQTAVATAVNNALAFLSSTDIVNSDGAFTTGPNVTTANANSTAMVILARIAAGENPAAGVKNPVSGLIADFGLSDFTGFGYSANTSSNAMATEQSFRALAAYKALAYTHNARPYYFGEPTLDGNWESSATSITLNKTELTLAVNGTEQLEATVTPEGQEIIWTSSDTDVATVSEDGLVTAVKAGTATITAKLNDGKKATCTVTVLEISLDKTELTLIEGDAEQLTATVSPEGAAVTWSSSDSDVATVSESGLVTAVKAGTATITAKVNDETTATCTVTVEEKTTTMITLDKTEITLTVGNTEQLTAKVNPETETVTWGSSDPDVATVSDDGLVTAVKAGTATITAALADGKEATCAVTVREETSISLNKTETTLTVGETEQLEATVNPETETVTWTSSDTDVATVSKTGLVTAVKAGTATITAALADGKEATCVVTVQKDPTKITISFTLLGDTVHGSNGHVHTLRSGNESLTTWIDTAYVTVPADSTVWELLEQVLTDNGYTWDNPTKNYVISITTPKGVTLEQKDNGSRSGWMYTLNGVHPNLGVSEQTLADGDTVVFHYTDDMTEETDVGGDLVVDSLSLNKEKLELDSGASEKLIATVDPLGAPVTWSSSDTKVATVSEDGKVAAVAAGSAVITATSGDKTAQCTVIVDGYDKVVALKEEIAALPDPVTTSDKAAVNTAKAHYDALTAAQQQLLTTKETAKLMKAVNTLQVLSDLDSLAETKDFASTDANTKNAVAAALEDWLKDSNAKVSITAFTAAADGTAAAPEGTAGSYSAKITLNVGTGDAAVSGDKTVTGSITPKAYAPGSDAGVKSIKVSGVAAKGSGTSYSAALPYGTDLSALTAKSFTITLKDTNAKVSAAPATADGGKTWIFTVTAEDGKTTKDYTVTLSVSDVKVTLLDSAIYSVADDVEVTSLSPAAVEGLLEAVSIDDLKLPEGTKTIGLWLKVTAVEKDGKDITVKLEPVYSYDGSDETAVPVGAIIDEFTVTLPIEGTEYARVLYDGTYLTAQISENGISFVVEVPGEYTVIPDARLVTVTFHLSGGSSDDVKDGEKVVYYRENAGDDLPQKVVKDDNRFEGWFDTEDGIGKVFATVSADLPDELYAVWSSDVKIQKVGDIDDKVTVTATVEDDVATITVTADEPCIVIVKNGDKYERMAAVKNEDGSYSFVQKDYDVNMVFYVAVLGDFDGDGDLDKDDLSAANKAIMSNKTVDPLKIMIMGAKGEKLKTVDLAKLCLALVNKKVEW